MAINSIQSIWNRKKNKERKIFIVLGFCFYVDSTESLCTNIEMPKPKIMLKISPTFFPLNIIVLEDKLIITLWKLGQEGWMCKMLMETMKWFAHWYNEVHADKFYLWVSRTSFQISRMQKEWYPPYLTSLPQKFKSWFWKKALYSLLLLKQAPFL